MTINHKRPYRAATASDDGNLVFYTGPPFRYKRTLNGHTSFVHDVAFSPDSKFLASVGADGQIFIFDGDTGDLVKNIKSTHQGSIFAISWNPESSMLMTSSADRTVKLWDVESAKESKTWNLSRGSTLVEDQQVGNIWTTSHAVTLSLGGTLNFLDPKSELPLKSLPGQQKSVTAFTFNESSKTFLTGAYDGRVLQYSAETGEASQIEGQNQTSQIVEMVPKDEKVYTVAYDDTLRQLDTTTKTYSPTVTNLKQQPMDMAVISDTCFVLSSNGLVQILDGATMAEIPLDNPTRLAAHENILAVGFTDGSISIFTYANNELTKTKARISFNKSSISSLAFSTDGKHLAAGDNSGRVMLIDILDYSLKTSRWQFQSGKVVQMSWDPAGEHLASASMDTSIVIYSVLSVSKHTATRNAHKDGVVGISWIDENTIASVGRDSAIKIWKCTS